MEHQRKKKTRQLLLFHGISSACEKVGRIRISFVGDHTWIKDNGFCWSCNFAPWQHDPGPNFRRRSLWRRRAPFRIKIRRRLRQVDTYKNQDKLLKPL